jgi:uncharacterized protein DUF1656
MTQTFRELVIGGVLVSPFASYVIAALVIFLLLRPLLHLLGVSRVFSNVPVAELSLYVTILGILTLWI